MKLSRELQDKIINFLKSLPNISETKGRRAFICSAGLDPQLEAQLPFDEAPAQFAPLLLSKLIKYGKLNNGQYALEVVLETAKNYVGQDREAYCEDILQELHTYRYEKDKEFLIFPKSFFNWQLLTLTVLAIMLLTSIYYYYFYAANNPTDIPPKFIVENPYVNPETPLKISIDNEAEKRKESLNVKWDGLIFPKSAILLSGSDKHYWVLALKDISLPDEMRITGYHNLELAFAGEEFGSTIKIALNQSLPIVKSNEIDTPHKPYKIQRFITDFLTEYFLSKGGKVEVLSVTDSSIGLSVKELKGEIISSIFRRYWEKVTIDIFYVMTEASLQVHCVMDGQYGVGFRPPKNEGYIGMEPEYSESLLGYKRKLLVALQKYMKEKGFSIELQL